MKTIAFTTFALIVGIGTAQAQVFILGSDRDDHATKMVYMPRGTTEVAPTVGLTVPVPRAAAPAPATIEPNHENDTVRRGVR